MEIRRKSQKKLSLMDKWFWYQKMQLFNHIIEEKKEQREIKVNAFFKKNILINVFVFFIQILHKIYSFFYLI